MKNDASAKKGMWQYIKQYRFQSIFTKCFLRVMFWVVLPLIIIEIGIYFAYHENSKQQLMGVYANSLDRASAQMEKTFEDVSQLGTLLTINDDIRRFAAMEPFEKIDYEVLSTLTKIESKVPGYLVLNDSIKSIDLYFERSDYVYSTSRGMHARKDLDSIEWYEEYLDALADYSYHFLPTKPGQDLIVIKKCGAKNKTFGIVFFIDQESIKGILNLNSENHEKVILTDADYHVYYSNEDDITNSVISDSTLKESLDEGKESVEICGEKMLCQNTDIDDYGMRLVLLVPEKAVEKQAIRMIPMFIIGILASVLFSIFVSWSIAEWLFRAVRILPEIVVDDMGISVKEEESRFAELNEVLNKVRIVGRRNSEMQEEIAHSMTSLYQAQIRTLQSQINPHFLYNTLDAISWKAMALTGGENEVVDMIGTLSKLLRCNTENSSIMHTIEEEIEHVNLYVKIMQYRKKNRFDFQQNISSNCMTYMIPKFTLQPLIENSIRYGMSNNGKKGIIRLDIQETDQDVILTVEDDGIGMYKEQVEYITEQMKEATGDKHIGLANVYRRLQLLYGEEYKMTIESEKDVGTKITVRVPKKMN